MKLSPDVISKIEAFVDAAEADIEAAAASVGVGKSSASMLVSFLRKLGADIPASKRGPSGGSKVDIELVMAMLARGCEKKAVAEHFGVKVATINLHLKKLPPIAPPSPADVLKELGAQDAA